MGEQLKIIKELEEKIKQIKEEHSMIIRKMQADHSNELEELKKKHKEEISNLKSDLNRLKEEEIKQIND